MPLGCTNKATLGIKLPSATIPAWQVNCGCLCTSMNIQWLLFCSNVWKNPPTAPHPPPIPTPRLPAHPLYTESRGGSRIQKRGGHKYIVVNTIIVSGAHNLACKACQIQRGLGACPPENFEKLDPL